MRWLSWSQKFGQEPKLIIIVGENSRKKSTTVAFLPRNIYFCTVNHYGTIMPSIVYDFNANGVGPDNVIFDGEFPGIHQYAYEYGPEEELYFYHSDHLGSSTFITDAAGEPYQFLQYLPFGKPFVSQHVNIDGWATLYTFSAKEQDAETGYHYFGARYYDSELSVWLSVDPMSDKHPDYTPFAYCYNNPTNLIDPDGRDTFLIQKGSGELQDRIETTEGNDVFIMVDDKGNRLENQSRTFDEGTIGEIRHPYYRGDRLSIFEVSGDDNATALFEFFADPDNTGVEWTIARVGTDQSGRNKVGTSHKEQYTAVGTYLRNRGYTLKVVNHNHPSGSPMPSGSILHDHGDVQNANHYEKAFPNILLNIYTIEWGYSPYDSKGTKDKRILKGKIPR